MIVSFCITGEDEFGPQVTCIVQYGCNHWCRMHLDGLQSQAYSKALNAYKKWMMVFRVPDDGKEKQCCQCGFSDPLNLAKHQKFCSRSKVPSQYGPHPAAAHYRRWPPPGHPGPPAP